jgi:hypothetical protein
MRRPLILVPVAVLLALLAVSVPVLAQDGTPATTPEHGESTIEVLLDASFTELPAGASGIFLEQWTFAPGAATLTMPPFPGLHWLTASDSAFAVTVDGDERSLDPGAGLVVPPGQEVVIRSTRETEALLLHGGVVAGYPPLQFDSRFITYRTPIASSGQMPTGAVRVVVERLMLAPGAALPRFTLAENQWIGLGHGTVGVTLEGERLPLYWASGDEREVAFPNLFPAIAVGTEMTMRNAGQDQLVLYRLSIMPSAGEAAAASTPLAGTPVSKSVADGNGDLRLAASRSARWSPQVLQSPLSVTSPGR